MLDHANEYSIREDIIVEMESLDLEADVAKALLGSPTPLADVFKEWRNTETNHMSDIRDAIENRAKYTINAERDARLTDAVWEPGEGTYGTNSAPTDPIIPAYLLIEVIEREISVPEEYETFELAQEAMFQKVAEAIGEEVETIREAYLSGGDIERGAVVLENMAYCESHGQNYDWMIFTSEDGEWRKASTPA